MYDVFMLRNLEEGKIAGYRWDLDDPKKVICIVHGIGEYGGRYDRVAETFREAGYAVYAMDLRGHGISLGKRGHCAPRRDVLEDIDALLSRAREDYPGKDIILYGHSMGGNITMDYRCRGEGSDIPSAYLISAPWIRLVRPIPAPVVRLVKALARVAPDFTIGSAVDEADLGNPANVLPYHTDPMVHNRISFQCAVDGFETGQALEEGTLEDLGKAKEIPTLVMHGEADRICDIQGTERAVEKMREKGNKVEYRSWPDLYHEIHNGGPESTGEEVLEEMIRFFET